MRNAVAYLGWRSGLAAALAAGGLFGGSAAAETKLVGFEVKALEVGRTDSVVRVPLVLDEAWAKAPSIKVADAAGTSVPGQLTAPAVTSAPAAAPAGKVARELVFVWPKLPANEAVKLTATLDTTASPTAESFAWKTLADGAEIELALGSKPVVKYMCAALDDSSAAAREKTYKPYHHVYNPAGDQLLSKGPGSKFPHHRGLYFGFMKVTYDEKKVVDVWHCKGDAHQSHEKVLASEAGPVLGRHTVLIAWRGIGKEAFAEETREVTAYRTPGGTLIEFASKVTPKSGVVKVDGDPQHAGFHFRANEEVTEKTSKETYYLRPDGKDAPGKFRNWSPGAKNPADAKHVDLPWNAMSFVVGGKRYTAEYIDRPQNPKEARFSERDYGRFGSYFVAEATPEKPLVVDYRFWVQEGEMDVAQANAQYANFTAPLEIKVP